MIFVVDEGIGLSFVNVCNYLGALERFSNDCRK